MKNAKSTKSKKLVLSQAELTPAQNARFTQRELNQAIKELSKEVNRKITIRLLKEMIAGK
jgi:hypothetical protein